MPTESEWTGAAQAAIAEHKTRMAHRIAEVRAVAKALCKRQRDEKERHLAAVAAVAAVAAIQKEFTELRKLCPHPNPEYFADAAGGSDSFHECPTCGDQW